METGFRVVGRVQGVGFRWWARSQARHLGLSGTVRNCADGSVELHVRGTPDAVGQLRGKLEHGPSGARVVRVEEILVPPVTVDGFEITR